MDGIKDSEEVMFKDAEFLANKIVEIFKDVYPHKDTTLKNIGKIEGVICYIMGSKGFFRLNSELLEVNKLSYVLFEDAKRMEAYRNLNILTGIKDFRSKE